LGLKGTDIPLVGRIVAVADVFDALSSRRSYKQAFPLDECFRIMRESRGNHFDPEVLDAFLSVRDRVVQVQLAFADEN
jgi:putative two-component system response regulator